MLLSASWVAHAERPVGLDRAVEPEAVSVERWADCVSEGACAQAPRTSEGPDGTSLVRVVFDQAQAFCAWQGGQLPDASDIEALGIKVPAHHPSRIHEWVASAGRAGLVRKAGTRGLRPPGRRDLHGVRCLWEIQPAEAPALPPFEPCLRGHRRAGQDGTTEARASVEGPWTCGGLSVWVEFPGAGPTLLDHWTGEIQTVVSERSDGSYGLAFRPTDSAEERSANDAWFVDALIEDAAIKRAGSARRTSLRDLEGARRATFKVRIPGQKDGRVDALWLTYEGWDVALVVGPGQYGGRADSDTLQAFFRSVAPSLVPGWRLALPAGGWFSVPSDGFSPRAPTLKPDRVRLELQRMGSGEVARLDVRRHLLGACPAEAPSAAQPLGEVTGDGWRGTAYVASTEAGQEGLVVGCSEAASVEIRVSPGAGAALDLQVLQAWAERARFPEASAP